jgi:hypothetical protein
LKKEAAPHCNVYAKKNTFFFGRGGSQLFIYFCLSRVGLDPNCGEKGELFVPLPALPYAFITCSDMQFEDSKIAN